LKATLLNFSARWSGVINVSTLSKLRRLRADGEPMGIAGLWSWWKSPKGDVLHSYTMLTINADQHPLMRQFHKPTDESGWWLSCRRIGYEDWLQAPADQSARFLNLYPSDALQSSTSMPSNLSLL